MTIEEYISEHSDTEPEYLAQINRLTHQTLINPRMMSGHLQGRVLSMFCKMIKPVSILELGTYVGYSALCMAESLPENGVLHTVECDDELEDIILANFAKSEYGSRIILHIGDALQVINKLDMTFDLVFIDADKRDYTAYYEAIMPKLKQGGFIIADNTLWDGKVIRPVEHNDKHTIEIMHFNDYIAKDERVEEVMLPLRDGLTIIRKK